MKDVAVYWHFRKKMFSVVDKSTGRVMCHARTVLLGGDVSFRVSEAGRQRVLREGRKNVHAKIHGKLIAADPRVHPFFSPDCTKKVVSVGYNPYRNESFVDRKTGERVDNASIVICDVVDGVTAAVREG